MGWWSVCVVKISERFVGMVSFRGSRFVVFPSCVSMPIEWGATSRSSTSFTTPVRTPAWSTAPLATASGLRPC